jgi:hypothetical protein
MFPAHGKILSVSHPYKTTERMLCFPDILHPEKQIEKK